MSKKSKHKNKKRRLRPPLTFWDKSIYIFCFLLLILGMLLSPYCFDDVQNLIAFNKPNTIAYRSNANFWLFIPFVLYIGMSTLIVLIMGWQSKKPILGSKKYKYGEFPFREDCFPLFHRKKYNVRKNPSQKKYARKMAVLWCSFLLLFTCLMPFSLFGRNALYQDNHIEKINLINHTGDTYTTNDFAHLTIRTDYFDGYRTPSYWTYEITIEMNDGKIFSFCNRDFNRHISGVNDICLDKMLEIKHLFGADSITIKGAKNVNKVADDVGLNESQRAKLNELFAD